VGGIIPLWWATSSRYDGRLRQESAVVTRLGPGGVCHVGYVDARINAKADALARDIADRRARSFQCEKDTAVVVGKREPGFNIVTP
jgi:hypothetical protein